MAGAGFKTFAVGDVLTAGDVNTYLMEQAVMTFADSGARGSAIGTATEGMVSYLADTDAVEVYDGSAWVGIGLPLGTATPAEGDVLAYGTATASWNPTALRPMEVGGEAGNTSMSPSSSRNVTFTFTVGRFTKVPVVAPSYFHGNMSYNGPRLTGAAGTASVTFEVQNSSGASQNSRLWYIAIQED